MIVEQLLYLAVLILIGTLVLFLRRQANGTRAEYKLILLFLGLLLGMLKIGESSLFSFDEYFLKSFSMFLLIILLFELSVRLNPDNVKITFSNISMFLVIIVLNVLVIGFVAPMLTGISFIHSVILAIILSSVEYFLVDKLKGEGDLANPFIILFAFTILSFYEIIGGSGINANIGAGNISNVFFFLKYILIGISVGIIAGIIVFRFLKNQYVTTANELGMVAVAVSTYILSEQVGGSGMFSVFILGVFYGNSYIKKTTHMHSFSPFIFKTLEMLIFLLIGFVVELRFSNGLWWKALLLYVLYLLLRLFVMHLYYTHYSFVNKLLLVFAPKGMVPAAAILVLGFYNLISDSAIVLGVFILIYSLIAGIILEYFEQQKEVGLDKALSSIIKRKFNGKFRRIRV